MDVSFSDDKDANIDHTEVVQTSAINKLPVSEGSLSLIASSSRTSSTSQSSPAGLNCEELSQYLEKNSIPAIFVAPFRGKRIETQHTQ